MGLWMSLLIAGRLHQVASKGPFQLKGFHDYDSIRPRSSACCILCSPEEEHSALMGTLCPWKLQCEPHSARRWQRDLVGSLLLSVGITALTQLQTLWGGRAEHFKMGAGEQMALWEHLQVQRAEVTARKEWNPG